MSDEKELPSEEELSKLPRASIVVYALRCALRVQPMWVFWEKTSAHYKKAIVTLNREYKILVYTARADVARAAYIAATDATDAAEPAAYETSVAAIGRADATYDAARAAASRAATRAIRATDATDAAYAAYAATDAADATAYNSYDTDAAKADYSRLKEMKTEVTDASETGPLGDLWHGSPPDWYIEAKANFDKTIAEWEREIAAEEEIESAGAVEVPILNHLQYKISFQVPSNMEDEVAIAKLKELVLNLNDSHKANGGSGIKVDLLEIYESENVCVPSSPEGT